MKKNLIFLPVLAIALLANCFPSWGSILILNGLTHEYKLVEGETRTGQIELKNISGIPQSVQIYQKDYWYSYTGETRHDEPGTLTRSNAKWLSINPLFVTLLPDETTTVEYELTVPKNDSLSGTYWSVIMVEGITPPDTTAAEKGIKINTVVRYAVQIIANIGENASRNLSFLNFNLGKEESTNYLQADIENTGEMIIRPVLGLEVFNAEGVSQGVIKAEPKKVYPGTSVRITLDLSSVKPGNYTGILVADCGDDYLFGSNLTFEIKNE